MIENAVVLIDEIHLQSGEDKDLLTAIAGLLFATVLTMVVVPVLYAIFYRVPGEPPPTSPV